MTFTDKLYTIKSPEIADKKVMTEMAVKCIALDMDKTTLNAQGKLSKENREALLYAIKKGVHVCIASGRAFSALPEDVVSLPGIEYAITCNGAEVYDVPRKKCLQRFCLPGESVKAIMKVTENDPVTYEAFIRGQAYAGTEYVKDPVRFGATKQAVEYVQHTRKMEDDIRAFILTHSSELSSMDIIVKDEEKKAEVWALLEESVKDIYITSSIQQLIEISGKNSGKHNGLKFLADLLCISLQETAAFGDADNDVEMLEIAGIGIAVANGSEKALAAADMITSHHDKNGVAEGIYKIL